MRKVQLNDETIQEDKLKEDIQELHPERKRSKTDLSIQIRDQMNFSVFQCSGLPEKSYARPNTEFELIDESPELLGSPSQTF